MGYWIDFEMLMSEIRLHRRNAQRRILGYKESNSPMPTSPGEYTVHGFTRRLQYENEVGAEIVLECIQKWCEDFKFSTEELKELDEFRTE